ncbi:MFS transporter [Alkalihalophilus sp. As8PL]|uniref:MFS transporter n=1 Tax=Alkalihalophilus sp. As8PL TaxID=3237103 RepID=A0AB39BXF0_9BACI
MNGKWKALVLIAIAELCALSLWFSGSVVAPELINVWSVRDSSVSAWLSAAVPVGFVIGALISAYYGLADRFNARKVFALSALIGAGLNGLLLWTDHAAIGIIVRVLTGMTLAGVYPTAVKLLSQWFPTKRGLAIGVLIAALTIGSALPQFFVTIFSAVNWKLVIMTSSFLALAAAGIVYWLLEDAPVAQKKASFSFHLIKEVIKNRPVMLANYGYFGHMWELYAMWTWLPLFLAASFLTDSPTTSIAFVSFASFLAIGIAGGLGSVIGGLVADKVGRARLTIYSMAISAACCVAIGFTFGQSIWLTWIIALIWGASVIADSAQFSAAVSEFADVEYIGTALTFQMCVGFLITIFSINLIPYAQLFLGWEWVFILLAIGPILGIISMIRFNQYET